MASVSSTFRSVWFDDVLAAYNQFEDIDLLGSPDFDESLDGSNSSVEFSCSLCSVSMSSLSDQREHFQSQWHVFNLKRRLKKQAVLTEAEFDQLIEDRDSEDERNEAGSDLLDDSGDEDCTEENNNHCIMSKLRSMNRIFFTYSADNQVYGVHRCLLACGDDYYRLENGEVNTGYGIRESLQHLLTNCRIWIIILLSGGRFAAGVFDGPNEVIHKTFHSYTVRAKQGGGQSSRDGCQGGSAPRSAGASLRRYNEASLKQHIRDMLSEWGPYVKQAGHIFLRCSSYDKDIFYGGKDPILSKKDGRIRGIPLVTKRPTFSEVQRVHRILSSVDCFGSKTEFDAQLVASMESSKTASHRAEAKNSGNHDVKLVDVRDLADRDPSGTDDELEKSLTRRIEMTSEDLKKMKKRRAPQPDSTLVATAPVIDDAPKQVLPNTVSTSIYAACKKGDAETLIQILEAYGRSDPTEVDPNPRETLMAYLNAPFGPSSTTFLHQAANEGHGAVLREMLDFGVDPTICNSRGQVAYQVAAGRPLRKLFVRFRAENPNKWEWNKAQIPEPLDPAEEARREEEAAEKRKIARKLKMERSKVKKAADAVIKAEEAEKLRYLSLSDREKRALAADRRILQNSTTNIEYVDRHATVAVVDHNSDLIKSAPVLLRCFQCAKNISGLVPFEYSDNRFCSPACVKVHRQSNS